MSAKENQPGQRCPGRASGLGAAAAAGAPSAQTQAGVQTDGRWRKASTQAQAWQAGPRAGSLVEARREGFRVGRDFWSMPWYKSLAMLVSAASAWDGREGERNRRRRVEMCQKECGAFRSVAGRKPSAALKEESLADGSCWPRGAQQTHSPWPQAERTERRAHLQGTPCPCKHCVPLRAWPKSCSLLDGCEEDTGHLLTGFISSPGGKHAVGFPERGGVSGDHTSGPCFLSTGARSDRQS